VNLAAFFLYLQADDKVRTSMSLDSHQLLIYSAARKSGRMQSPDAERWRNLSELAAREQDAQKLRALVLELTKMLEKEVRARQQRDAA
jgi:hypothetical protein